MTRMRAIDAALQILEREGITCAFGVPGAAINPLYSAMLSRGRIKHYAAFEKALAMMAEFEVPVVVEVILEKVTNIAMGTQLDNVTEFEELADREILGQLTVEAAATVG